MMAQKALLFNDNEIFHKIMSSKSPKEYKELGKKKLKISLIQNGMK